MNISQPLTSHSSIFYKKEGTIFISDDSWKLIIYKELKPLFISHESLLRLSEKFQSMSSQYINFSIVQSTKSFLSVNLQKIENRLSELKMYLGKNSRSKRELLDGLGSVLKWLIGTPDAKDAKRYDECINKLEKHELDLTELMQKQIQITLSTVKNFNETIFKISFDEQIINENINRLNDFMNKSEKLIFDIKISEDISSISLQILELVTSLENEINDCLTSILFAKSNIVHPSIITLAKLYEQLLKSNKMRNQKQFVTPVTIDNIHTLLDSSSLSAYVYSNRPIYILEFPLVHNNPLTLYHMYSIPIQHPNSSFHTTIIPEHIFLATDPSGQYYASTSSLDKCNVFASRRSICKDLVIYDSAARPICEVQLLFSKSTSIPTTCTTTTFSAEINTFQPLGQNSWLYILNKETNCVLQCNSEITTYKLQGSGILTLPTSCKLHTGYSTLSAFYTSEENITFPIIVPDIRNDDCFETTKQFDSQQLIPITINEMPLDSLKSIRNHLDKYSEDLKKIQNSKTQSFIENNRNHFTWISLLIGTIMLTYLLFKLCKQCPGVFTRRTTDGTCVQIFNNCFDNSSRRRNTQIAIPMRNLQTSTSCISDDEDDDGSPSPHTQRSGANAQSLF